jgi:hypothetical protein
MDFKPRRITGTLIGAGFLLLLGAATVGGLSQVGAAPVTAWIILWVLLPLVSLPLAAVVGYRLYGLWTAAYRIDRDGFYLRWGLAREQIPLDQVESVRFLRVLKTELRPDPGWHWPGCVTAVAEADDQLPIEIFAGAGLEKGLLITSAGRRLAVAPADPQGFVKSFTDATRLGSLQPIAPGSERPAFVLTEVWADRRARGLILVGGMLPLALLAFVGWRAAGLTGTVPFGFDAFGRPGPGVPPGRLLLLPFMAGVVWLVDLAIGGVIYRRESQRGLAYTLWAAAVVTGLLLWGAVVHLMSNV